MAASKTSFKVGRVRVYLRGRMWYLCYYEGGRRKRYRAHTDRKTARRMAAELNAQIETGAPTSFSFDRVSLSELRKRWLNHHENVKRSSLHTIRRYRSATDHLIKFVNGAPCGSDVSRLGPSDAEQFLAHLRSTLVAPNGHKNTPKRRLLDKGILFIAETCRTLFGYAATHRHLPPYAKNPFSEINVCSMQVDDSKPVRVLTAEEEKKVLDACDEYLFPVMLTMMMTGLRPAELTHLLLPQDLDLDRGVLRVINKPRLSWTVKTKSEREVPLSPELVEVLKRTVAPRAPGLAFPRRVRATGPTFTTPEAMEATLQKRITESEQLLARVSTRQERAALARRVWREAGLMTNEQLRREFIRVTKKAGIIDITTPKTMRHGFATMLQEANVDPVVRMQLMGHAPTYAVNRALGMTAWYTHTRPETMREQLLAALAGRPTMAAAVAFLHDRAARQADSEHR